MQADALVQNQSRREDKSVLCRVFEEEAEEADKDKSM